MQELSSLEYFLHLTRTVGEFWVYSIPVTGTIAIASLWTAAVAFHKPDLRWRPALAVWVIPALFPLLALIVGVAYVDSHMLAFIDRAPPRPWVVNAPAGQPQLWIRLIGISFLVTTLLEGWWLRKHWGVVLAAGLFWGPPFVLACAVANMSYAGIWL